MKRLIRLAVVGMLALASGATANDDELAFAFQMKPAGAAKATSIAMYDDVETTWRQSDWKGSIRVKVAPDGKKGAVRVQVLVGPRDRAKIAKEATLLPNEAMTLKAGQEVDAGYFGAGVESLQLLYTGRITP